MADFNDLLISSQTLLPPQSQQLQYSISQLSAVSATVAPPTSLQPQQSYAALHNQEAIAHRFFAGRNFDTENLNSNVMELDLQQQTHNNVHVQKNMPLNELSLQGEYQRFGCCV
tara:strand:+ start:49 stop:390 length:342 start_codon:yes stop_codon:yes gene_type:complete